MRYYSTRQTFLIVSSTIKVEETKKIDKFLELLDKSGVCDLIKKQVIHDERNKVGRPGYNVYNMLAAIIYSFAFNKASLRNIEDLCIYDLRIIYIMEYETPTYKTIGNFINEYIVPNRDIIFLITKAIFEECNLKMDRAYIDWSKFEADANKYKFVWKPTTFHLRLSDKIRRLLGEYNLLRGVPSEGIVESKIVANKLIELNNVLEQYDLSIKINKHFKEDYSQLYQYLEKSLEYEEKERICGPNRNSYYKTDKDATAMCLKEDYYSGLGSNMHAAYNAQLCVIYGLISSYIVIQSWNDLEDFIKILEKHYEMYGSYPNFVGADSGYGSLKNYRFLEEHNIKNFVKYLTWEGNVSGKRPSQYRINKNNTITCLKGNIGTIENNPPSHPRKKNTVFYKIEGCNNCEYMDYCKRFMKDKTKNFKYFEVSQDLQNYIQEAEKNLLSPEGIEMRVNRSSQVEGAFGVIKQDFKYERFRRTLLPKVSTEFMLVCLGYNIRKLFKFYSGNAKLQYWKAPVGLQVETFKKPSAKRLSNKADKVKKKSLNVEVRSKYMYK